MTEPGPGVPLDLPRRIGSLPSRKDPLHKMNPEPIDSRTKITAYYSLLVIAGIWAASQAVSSGDLWVALGCGRYILDHGVGRTDPFSFTSPAGHWVNQNWLSHILFTTLDRIGGLTALGIWKGLVCVTISLLTASSARALGASRFFSLGAGIGIAIVGRPFHDIRPNLHTILLGAVTVRWLVGFDPVRLRSWWPILLVMALWANLHGGFLFGVLAIGLASAVLFLQAWRKRIPPRPGATMLVLPILCLAVTLVSPYGLTNLTHPYEVSFGPAASHWRNVVEWRPPFGPGALDAPGVRAFWVLLLLGGLVLGVSRFAGKRSTSRRMMLPITVVALLTLGLSLTSRRFIPLFAVASLPPLAAFADRRTRRRKSLAFAWPIVALVVATTVTFDLGQRLVLANAIWPASVDWASRLVRMPEQPVSAVDFLITSRLKGRLLADWTWGGYLLYRDRVEKEEPLYRIFIDGRAQAAYPVEVSQDWVALVEASRSGNAEAVAAFLDYYKIDVCLLDRRGPHLASLVPELGGWAAVYGDDSAVVAVREETARSMITGTFPDEAIASASAALYLRSRGEMTREETAGAFRLAVTSVRDRPTTVGVTEMVRLALGAPEPLAGPMQRQAAEECGRILEQNRPAGTDYEIATLTANTAQSRAALASAAGDIELGRRMRATARREAARAAAMARRFLR